MSSEYTTYTYAPIPFRCPVYEGRRTMPENFYSRMTFGTGMDTVECKTCEGDGIVWSDRRAEGGEDLGRE